MSMDEDFKTFSPLKLSAKLSIVYQFQAFFSTFNALLISAALLFHLISQILL